MLGSPFGIGISSSQVHAATAANASHYVRTWHGIQIDVQIGTTNSGGGDLEDNVVLRRRKISVVLVRTVHDEQDRRRYAVLTSSVMTGTGRS